ncbi:7TM diverse intracellular signaling domain-containing protein [Pedobacter sp.]|uniref:7TM diverse intracellular signaling domain-containing protein n=1 Tax=Pedobacter sp. TaxID=1411316 RepID=UPI003D7FC726
MINKILWYFVLLVSGCLSPVISNASAFDKTDSLINILHFSKIYIQQKQNVETKEILLNDTLFKKLNSGLLNLSKYPNSVWIKAEFPASINLHEYNNILIDQSRIKHAQIFFVDDHHVIQEIDQNNYTNIANQNDPGNLKTYIIPNALASQRPTIFIRLFTNDVVMVPVFIGKQSDVLNLFSIRDVFFGIYTGIMLIMFAYNLFLYFSIKDLSYLNYIFCILFTWATQTTIQGYFSKYFHVDSIWFNEIAVTLFSNLGLLASITFTKSFLSTKQNTPKSHLLLNIIFCLIIIDTILLCAGFNYLAFMGMQICILGGSIVAFTAAFNAYFYKNFKPAGYYLASWTFLFLGMMIFILKDYEIIGYSLFSNYSAQLASVLEVLLLSFALADRINFFKKENELSQKQALVISKENERLILEQNVILENKVNERTTELQNINSTLNLTLTNLKAAQSQLVDAEKMAALGQLTAGIAHEINNPINFVTSNIKPLELDIKDLKEVISMYEAIDYNADIIKQLERIEAFKKQIDLKFVNEEIASLLSGISEGAKRTAEIIRSLRNFSRIDESDTKPVDLNEGLDSTLVLIRSTFPHQLKIKKEYGDIPPVDCMPGKINQVFMNLITNAVHAIKSKPILQDEEFLTVKTWREDNLVKISIKDTGSGMPDEVKQKIFEPFYTTKDVGEGTGLGLSIVFRIIENHQGSIDVLTKINQGTEFIITLPLHTK